MIPDCAVSSSPAHVARRSLAAVPVDAVFVETITVELLAWLFCVEQQYDRFPLGRNNSGIPAASKSGVDFCTAVNGACGKRAILGHRRNSYAVAHASLLRHSMACSILLTQISEIGRA